MWHYNHLSGVWHYTHLSRMRHTNEAFESSIFDEEFIFSHLCLYEIGLLPMWETSISHDHVLGLVVQGIIHSKVWEKESIMSQSMLDKEISPLGEEFRLGTRQASSLVEIPPSWVRFPYPNGCSWWILIISVRWCITFISVSWGITVV